MTMKINGQRTSKGQTVKMMMTRIGERAYPTWLPGLALAASLAFAAVGAQAAPSERVQVMGEVKAGLDLTVDELARLPADQLGSVTVTRRVDGKDVGSTVRGIRLATLLERAGLATRDHNDWKRMVVLACGIDGYCVSFSWPELSNTEVGAGVLVIFERDGQPLGDGEGRIALVSARDINGGPRHVKWLAKVVLRRLEP